MYEDGKSLQEMFDEFNTGKLSPEHEDVMLGCVKKVPVLLKEPA